MKVVLLKDVKDVGRQGDVCAVSDGHARNFLFPRQLAVLATPDAVREGERAKKRKTEEAERDLHSTEDVASAIDGFELEVKEKANDVGTLFAAVTAKKVADELKKRGYAVEATHVRSGVPIKECGEFDLQLEFPHGLEATIKVIVTSE